MPSLDSLSRTLERIKNFINIPYTPLKIADSSTYKPFLLWLFISFIFACIFVLPFYTQWVFVSFGLQAPLALNSILGLLAVSALLFAPKAHRFSIGFFIGVLWFYWISLGLRYFDMHLLIPFVVLLIGLFMGLVFFIVLWCDCLILRFIFLMLLSFFTPLGFDWIIVESMFSYSYFGVDKLSFGLILLGLWLVFKYAKYYKILGIVCLICALDSKNLDSRQDENATSPLKIALVEHNLSQDFNLRFERIDSIFEGYMEDIRAAIKAQNDVVVLPESAFYIPIDAPYFKPYLAELLELSYEIIIITGALRIEDITNLESRHFNSTYKFENGSFTYFDKVLLVPFGEYLPSFIVPIAKAMFEGIGGFSAGEDFGYFEVKNMRFKNAICYEATSAKFYADSPALVIATSNNAWFVPSIEPILQKHLMKYYARLYNSHIFHASNLSPSAVITP